MVGFGKLTPPSPSSALPPQDYLEAVPKYISGRTSYLRVRLAFHPYPQLIPYLCTGNGFGPSLRYYRSFNLAMGSSPGFGSNPDNTPGLMEVPPPASVRRPSSFRQVGTQRASGPLPTVSLPPGRALFRLAFAAAPELIFLNQAAWINSPAHSSIGTRSVRRVGPPTACKSTVSGLFHSPPGVLFTFPSRYWFTIGGQGYLALEGGPPRFPQDFTCPVVLNITPEALSFSPTGLSPSLVVLSRFIQLRRRFVTSCSLLRLEQACVTTPNGHRASAH